MIETTCNKRRNTLKMVDFSLADNRSAGAMLRGYGDGREKAWEKFSQELLASDPGVSEEMIAHTFSQMARKGKLPRVKFSAPAPAIVAPFWFKWLGHLLVGSALAVLMTLASH